MVEKSGFIEVHDIMCINCEKSLIGVVYDFDYIIDEIVERKNE